MKADRTVPYLIAVLGVTLIGVGSLVALEIGGREVDRGLIAQILAIVTPTLVALLALLRGEANGQAIGQVTERVNEAAEKAEVAATKAEKTASALAGSKTDTPPPLWNTGPFPAPYRSHNEP